jgi:hypothetical protein
VSSSAQIDANLLEEIGDLKGGGDVGESVYGEKADMRPVFGEGIRGDFKAIIAVRVASGIR